MNLSEPFIVRPVMTTLIMVAICVLGLMAFDRLPVSNLPDVNYPTINVSVSFPGASPSTMANTVATPLEKEFMTIPGITSVTSNNFLGSSSIVLEFDVNKNIDAAAVDVEAAISRAQLNLPPNLPNVPTYKKVNPSDSPIIYLALTSATMRSSELYTYANTFIGQRISMLAGVAQVITYGSPFAVRVKVDPGLLATYNLSLGDIASSLDNANQNLPTGQFDGKAMSETIYANGQLLTAAAYDPIIVAYREGAPVRVRDIGQAVDSLQNDKISLRYVDKDTNQPTVVLAVQRQPDANTVKVADSIAEILPNLLSQLPGSVDMHIVFDRSQSIKESISEVEFTLIIAFLLVVAVIYVYLGTVRDTVIPSLVLPMSIIATFAVMYPLGYTIDNLSLLALTLAIGFIVDDAIVVLENIVRHVEGGESPWDAALIGSKQISFTILSMTLSLVAVFIPILFMAGLIGKIFQEFAVTLMIVTLASGIISLTLTPMLCSRFIPPRNQEKEGKIARYSAAWNAWMLKKYQYALQKVLDHKPWMLAVGIVSVVLSAILFKILPTDFIPDDDIGFVIAYNEAEQGTSSERMLEYQHEVIEALRSDPGINTFVSIAAYPQYRQGINFLRLKPHKERKSSSEIIQELYPKVGMLPGVNTYFKNVPLIDLSIGAATKGPYQYTLQSLDTAALYQAGEELLTKMRNDPTFQGITSDLEVKTPQLDVNILRDQAYVLGVDAHEIENSLLLAYSGNRVSRIQTPIDQYDVILELEDEYQRDPLTLSLLYMRSKTSNALVPMNAVASWKESVGPASINHLAQFPAVTITFNVAPGIPLGTGLERIRQLASEVFSPKVTGSVKGAAETFESAIKSSGFLLLIAIFAIYIVLGVLYESFIHPLTILSTLPPAILGALLTLYFFGMPLSLYAYLGLILLIGIVKKNGIMMVDYALHNIQIKKESPRDSIFDACLVRFRPIMMTTMAAVMGAVPIALGVGSGAEARRPLGYVIIGGLLFSQLITLFLTPVIYLYLEKWNERFTFKRTPE